MWAVALTGNGDAFCSGLDLDQDRDRCDGEDAERSALRDERDAPTDHLSLLMRVECEKPVLAGVNGVAVGLGLSLAMNADIRIAAPSARFHPGYARVGTSPDGGLTWTLTRAVGYERAMRFLLEQRMVSAPEALALGLVSEVAETDDEFRGTVPRLRPDARRRRAPRGPPDQAASRSRRSAARLAAHLDDEIDLALHGLASDDSKEAVRAMRRQGSA